MGRRAAFPCRPGLFLFLLFAVFLFLFARKRLLFSGVVFAWFFRLRILRLLPRLLRVLQGKLL